MRLSHLLFIGAALTLTGPAAAVDYLVEVRASQFDPFTTDSSTTSAYVSLTGAGSSQQALAHGREVEVTGSASGNGPVRTDRASLDNLDVTFDASINGLAVANTIDLEVPFTLTYRVDVSDAPSSVLQSVSALDVQITGRVGGSVVGSAIGLLTLLNSSTVHEFSNLSGVFALEPAAENNTTVTIDGELLLSMPDDPGNPITLVLDVTLEGDQGATVGLLANADGFSHFEFHLEPDDITAGGTPLSSSGTGYTVSATPVPALGAIGLALLMGAFVAGGTRALRTPRR